MEPLQLVSTSMTCLLCTMTASHVKVTAQPASYRAPTPIKVWRKPDIRCPLVGNSNGRWGKAKLPVPKNCCVFPVAVPTVTRSAARSMLTTGVLAEKYLSVAPKSTMPVALARSARWRSVWVQLVVTLLMSGKGGGFVSRVGLKLVV